MINIKTVFFIIIISLHSSVSIAKDFVKCVSDLNYDKKNDYTFLAKKNDKYHVFALISSESDYFLHDLIEMDIIPEVSCFFFNQLSESAAGKNTKKTEFQIDNYGIKVKQLEGAEVVFYWKQGKIEEVWISD